MSYSSRFIGVKEGCKTLFSHIVLGKERYKLLESFGWYPNMIGGWTHPHCLDYMSHFEICSLNSKQLEYKLKYGSQSSLPNNLI